MSIPNQSLLFLLFFAFACKEEKSVPKEFKVGKISFEYPSNWKLVEPQTIDSYYSFITNKKDTIFIEYGSNSNKMYRNALNDNLFKQITAVGREIVIEIPKSEYGSYAVYIPKIDSQTSTVINSTKSGKSEELSKIFSSIKLENHDFSKALDIGKVKYVGRSTGTGITHYENNCLSCHSEFNTVIGPPLDQKFILSKDRRWLTDYLYTTKKNDDIGIQCFQFSKRDSIIVNELVRYLKQK